MPVRTDEVSTTVSGSSKKDKRADARGEIMVDDILLNKTEIINRCIRRILDVVQDDMENLLDLTKQDSVIFNLQRACEAAIDIAMHVVSLHKLGIPQSSRDAFDFLQKGEMISQETAVKMKRMVGFRNIAVHDYQAIQLVILENIIRAHLTDFHSFLDEINKG